MSEEQPIQTLGRALSLWTSNVAQVVNQTVKAVLPILESIRAALWEAYRQAGMPYGDSQEGLMRWMEDMGTIRRHEAEIERIRQHHDNLITGRKIGEAMRAHREERML